MKILGIETSCDDTGIAIYDSEQGVLANQLHSQIALHNTYGGVVPELASRDHIRRLIPLLEVCLQSANCSSADIDAIAYTAGPGLIGALLVGSTFARSLGYAWKVPAIAVNHMEAHLLSPLLETPAPEFPFLSLIVSGGHTMLVSVEEFGQYQLLGETLDDAVGEAFDKTAKLMGLPYPGGPLLAKLAEEGDPNRFHFPRPMTNRPGLEFSFSGLKTFALRTWETSSQDPQTQKDVARAFQDAVVDTLVIKCRRALEIFPTRNLVVAGGVSANRELRRRLTDLITAQGGTLYCPRFEFCTDNGAMVAFAGCQRWLRGDKSGLTAEVRARWPLTEI